MINKADTRYSLVPTEPTEIIRCAIVACLAVGGFFAVVHLTAMLVGWFA